MTYRKVASWRLSQLVAHSRIFRIFMKGNFDAYVLWPLDKMVKNWIVDRSTTRDFKVVERGTNYSGQMDPMSTPNWDSHLSRPVKTVLLNKQEMPNLNQCTLVRCTRKTSSEWSFNLVHKLYLVKIRCVKRQMLLHNWFQPTALCNALQTILSSSCWNIRAVAVL